MDVFDEFEQQSPNRQVKFSIDCLIDRANGPVNGDKFGFSSPFTHRATTHHPWPFPPSSWSVPLPPAARPLALSQPPPQTSLPLPAIVNWVVILITTVLLSSINSREQLTVTYSQRTVLALFRMDWSKRKLVGMNKRGTFAMNVKNHSPVRAVWRSTNGPTSDWNRTSVTHVKCHSLVRTIWRRTNGSSSDWNRTSVTHAKYHSVGRTIWRRTNGPTPGRRKRTSMSVTHVKSPLVGSIVWFDTKESTRKRSRTSVTHAKCHSVGRIIWFDTNDEFMRERSHMYSTCSMCEKLFRF